MGKIRVLVVEDSLTTRKRMVDAISGDPECEVVGEAADAASAIALCTSLRPDVVTLDLLLPDASGLEVTEHIMAYRATPIVIVSATVQQSDVRKTLDMLAAGAVDVLEKPNGNEPENEWERKLVDVVKFASRIKVITHLRGRRRVSSADGPKVSPPAALPTPPVARRSVRKYEVIAIGASTGGPSAVLALLTGTLSFGLPILLTIHVSQVLGGSFAAWLGSHLSIPVSEALDGELLPSPGDCRVIVAPADRHMFVERGRLRLSNAPERNACRPSVDILFESIAREKAERAIGVLLTGMGRDGAEGLLAMKQAGATTIAQNEATCVVFGMPREAIRLGAVDHVLPLGEIRSILSTLSTSSVETAL